MEMSLPRYIGSAVVLRLSWPTWSQNGYFSYVLVALWDAYCTFVLAYLMKRFVKTIMWLISSRNDKKATDWRKNKTSLLLRLDVGFLSMEPKSSLLPLNTRSPSHLWPTVFGGCQLTRVAAQSGCVAVGAVVEIQGVPVVLRGKTHHLDLREREENKKISFEMSTSKK